MTFLKARHAYAVRDTLCGEGRGAFSRLLSGRTQPRAAQLERSGPILSSPVVATRPRRLAPPSRPRPRHSGRCSRPASDKDCNNYANRVQRDGL